MHKEQEASWTPKPLAIATDAPVLVTGGNGMLGKALLRELKVQGFTRLLAPGRQELDLLDRTATENYLKHHRPALVFHLASIVFGLLGNMRHQVQAIGDNTRLNLNLLGAASAAGVRRLFFAGTVAIYPFPYRGLPLKESMVWEGKPHYGEYGYASAKRHALAQLEILAREEGMEYTYGLLTNLYGPEDRYDDQNGHVIPSLITKMHRAVTLGEPLTVWGNGAAKRDFLHAADAARAILLATRETVGCLNLASGDTVTIRQLVETLCHVAGHQGQPVWQTDKPVGIPERSVCTEGLRSLGFRPLHNLEKGLKDTWDWYAAHHREARHAATA